MGVSYTQQSPKILTYDRTKNSTDALTSLRFFAAMMIVVFHLKGVAPFHIPGFLSTGVSFFFVLSGFILTYNYFGKEFSWKTFYRKRFARLYPVHLFTAVLALTLVPVGAVLNNPNFLGMIATNFTLTQAWVPVAGFPFSLNGVSWSISTEMFFYLVFPFALILLRRSMSMFFVLTMIGFIATPMLIEYLFDFQKPRFNEFYAGHLTMQFPGSRLWEFLFGVFIGRLFLELSPSKIVCQFLEIISIVGIVLVFIFYQTIKQAIPDEYRLIEIFLMESGFWPLFGMLIFSMGSGHTFIARLLHSKILVLLGQSSFALYMIHQIVIKASRDSIQVWGNDWIEAGLIVFCSVVLSILFFKGLEEPCRKLLMGKKPKQLPTGATQN